MNTDNRLALSRTFDTGTLRDPRTLSVLLAAITIAAAITGFVFMGKSGDLKTRSELRDDALAAATAAVPALLSYDPASIADLVTQNRALMTDDFAEEYQQLVDDQLLPTVEKRDLATDTQVAGASIVELTESSATVLLFLNQLSSSADTKVPAATGSRVRATFSLVGDEWLLSEMQPI